MTDTSTSENQGDPQNQIPHEALKELCTNNASYYKSDNTENGQRLYTSFMAIIENVEKLWPIVLEVEGFVSEYDFDENTPANGYRSFLSIVDSAILYGIQLNKKICLKRSSVLFRKTVFTKEAETCAQIFASLLTCLEILKLIRANCAEGDLFTFNHLSMEQQIALMFNIEKVNQYCFYGRCVGFQFCESMRAALRFITLSIAIFSEAYYSEGSLFAKATTSFKNSTKYFTDPEEKAKRLVNIFKNADIEFCRAFWFLSEAELMKHLPAVVACSVSVSKVIHIPTEPMTVNCNGKEINVPIPNSHIGRKAVQVRLISWRKREGMIGEGTYKLDTPSRGLFVHCHGGGFVAQSSRSHECYLRQWAKDLDVPILSIDYSLAPQAPYPRALEEVLYAYCWVLKFHHLLGSTGERIIVGGDSAGANLLTAMTLKCLELDIEPPKGLFLAYAPTSVSFQASPARLLTVLDPLLPFGFLMRCLKAYTCPDLSKSNGVENVITSDTESFEEISESDLLDLQAHKSPVSDASDTLTYASLTSPQEEKDLVNNDPNSSQKYVSEFLEKYALDSDTDTDLTRAGDASQSTTITVNAADTPNPNLMQSRIGAFVSSLRGRIESLLPIVAPSGAAISLDTASGTNVIDEMRYTNIPRDPYISPLCADDDILRRMPPIKLFTVHLDPCLDDCVMFGRKLKRLGVNVTFDVLDGLPHGFLNFNLISKEAYNGSKLCTDRILELLDLESLPPRT